MTSPVSPVSEAHSKGSSSVYLGGALVAIGFAILTLGRASEWFDYTLGVVLFGVAVTLAYQGFAKRRRTSDK